MNDLTFDHHSYGIDFYKTRIRVERRSGTWDIIPVTLASDVIGRTHYHKGDRVRVTGELRSYIRGKNFLQAFGKTIERVTDAAPDENVVVVEGSIYGDPEFRTTPNRHRITNFTLRVKRMYESVNDYLPCISWGGAARIMRHSEPGDKMICTGRIQSRRYRKVFEDGTYQMRTAIEVSVYKWERQI